MIVNKYKKIIISSLLFFILLIGFQTSLAAGTYNFADQSGLSSTGDNAGYSDALKNLSPSNTASKVIDIVLGFLGIIFFGLMIYGGMTWMTAEGNDEKVTRAKNIIVGSIVGFFVVLAAYAASYFIFNYFSPTILNQK